jgi:hypothetical protein
LLAQTRYQGQPSGVIQGVLLKCVFPVSSGLKEWVASEKLKILCGILQKLGGEVPRAIDCVFLKQFEHEVTSVVSISRSLLQCWGLRLKIFPAILLISPHGRMSSFVD